MTQSKGDERERSRSARRTREAEEEVTIQVLGCGSRHTSAFLAGVQIALQVPVANDGVAFTCIVSLSSDTKRPSSSKRRLARR